MPESIDLGALERVIRSATEQAMEYRQITGRPLGIAGEVGEFHAARLLGLQLAEARQPGYDAVARDGHRIQVKARCIFAASRPGQRLGRVSLDHPWRTVALVLMDGNFTPRAIYEAHRAEIERELTRPGSRARTEQGSLGVSKFKAIAPLVWASGE